MSVGGDDETIAGQATFGTAGSQAIPAQLVARRYKIVRWLGGGGMGRVYEAHDTELDEKVALKVLNSGLSEEAVERFRREVRLTRKIQHRNIARMFDIGEHQGERFLTMELVAGQSLAREVSSQPIAWSRLRRIAEQICLGLGAAHEAGVIHRDLKPDNILIETGTDRVVITDFGIARSLDDASVTQVGAVVGTPRYMAPEQLDGSAVDHRADLFSLGVMLFELATGTRPWSGDNPIAVAVAMATTTPRSFAGASVPQAFADLVAKCISIEPDDRPAGARDVFKALADLVDVVDAPLPAAPRTPAPTKTTAVTSRHTPMTYAQEVTTLAVLPVACAPADEYLADGIFEDLTDALSTTPGLRVRPAGVVRTLTPQDPRELGKQLSVDHVVVSSLRRTPTGLRVAARLIGVVDGFQIWAHKADCVEAEVLSVADTFAQAIASALSARATSPTRPTDPRAVDLYLRARAELRQFWGNHAQTAADLLEEATRYAPSSPPILGALAYASVHAWVMRGVPELAAKAERALERGLATGHGEAYLASAQWLLNHGDNERGAADLGLALVRAPMSAPAHEMAARILVEIDAASEARAHFETAVGLDPGRVKIISADLARLDALQGDWVAADTKIAALVADPDISMNQLGSVFEARFAGWRGNREALVTAASKFIPRMGDNATRMLQFVASSTASGALDHDAWRRMSEGMTGKDRPSRSQIFGLQLLTEISVVLGAPDVAMDTLRQAATLGLLDLYWIDHCPVFRTFVDDRRFVAIRHDVAQQAARVGAAFRSVGVT